MALNGIKMKLASPEDIRGWSHGEVIKPETINYRTQRPEKDGLFSERIFGPTKDWECYCGKYRRIRYRGITCDKCGVEVTRAAVRRERMGHIDLAVPVAHIWFLRNIPSKIGLFLDVPISKLEKVIYYVSYIVIAVNEDARKAALEEITREVKARRKTMKEEGASVEALEAAADSIKDQLTNLAPGYILQEAEYYDLARRFGHVFTAGSGAAAVRKILENADVDALADQAAKDAERVKEPAAKARLLRRVKLITGMARSGIRPEWMIMTVLPVLPPDLRPMVALDGGRYATSDLNDLYRRVINRNNRLKRLMELKAPEIIMTNEKRMLQEAVDSLVDNSARLGSQQLSVQRRPLRSLADMLKGKQGRFRQNLLGKRVDYSGRSVIVVGPELHLHQCGLPKKMALEIFKPFVISKILERGMAHNIRNANRLIEQASPEIWAILEEVIEGRKVLLNRAPTLHRLGIQAFQPLLIEDLAIRVPPLVCTAFNADFDGDQMAVHLPLTDEAQKEATELMLASGNLLKPGTGDPIAVPAQDMVLGCYYLTKVNPEAVGSGKKFTTKSEAIIAHNHEVIAVNAAVTIEGIETSVGRMYFNEVLPKGHPYINETMNKKRLSTLIGKLINEYGIPVTAIHLDEIKRIGFEYASKSGISWGMDDLILPIEKEDILAEATKEEAVVRTQFGEGLLTNEERRAKVIEIWIRAKEKIKQIVTTKTFHPHSSVYSIIDSGARGSWSQSVQLVGMKGLVQNPRGDVLELPVKTSLKEGHNVLEYFISTHGARKGTTDTALKTAQAGYLARRLVDVSQDVVIREQDCGTKEGIDVFRSDAKKIGIPFSMRLFSRTSLNDVMNGKKKIVGAGEIMNREMAEAIDEVEGIESVKIRSLVTCKTIYGVCANCYGYDLGKNEPIAIGGAVGIVAAQSISEPGTQLTMRTFHAGGVAGADITHGLPRIEELFEARSPKGRAFLVTEDGTVDSIEEKGLAKVVKINTFTPTSVKGKTKQAEYSIPRSAQTYVTVGAEVKKGDQLCEGNVDLKEMFSLKESVDVQRYIVNEVQSIYAAEGTPINDKHIEIIVRQMFSRVEIKEQGDSVFITGDVVEKSRFFEVNRILKREGRQPAKGKRLLWGIQKVALSTESFLSAASFMTTARILVNASVEGKVDYLRGLKENVIIGRLIPVGTGLHEKHNERIIEKAHVSGDDAVEVPA